MNVIFRVSTSQQKLVGRVDEGEELVTELTRICRSNGVAAADLRAVGQFSEIELAAFDPRRGEYVKVVEGEGYFELVSLNGNVSTLGDEVVLRLDAVFNALGPAGPQLVAGQLRRAKALSAEFVIEVFGDLRMKRRLDTASGRLDLETIEQIERKAERSEPAAPAASAAPSAPATSAPAASTDGAPGLSWADAIAEADSTETRREQARKGRPAPKKPAKAVSFDDEPEGPWLKAGDILDHPKLGRCRVMKVEDEDYCHIRLPRGKIRKMMMEVLDIRFVGEEDGRNVFEARVRR
ncbi:DNA-binding protein [Lujinxingia sediminis]|uniref:DNA-binding protein n=1 Tax=Lujinxingia sediminis TaxID=2480984 RepID=A0ABY0CSE5_9DELT|nr:PPC domain-containing DNA-binding protein [Lujinxingia sediminis]RVU43186.1 DNA-binding protein [Lujinxingia sediminis]